MFSFIHAADLHLDSPLEGLDEDAPKEAIRDATSKALRNLVRLAIEQSVQFVVLAGDIYDHNPRDYAPGFFFNECMKKLDEKGIQVFLTYGNHDAASILTKTLPLPKNVYAFHSKRAHTFTHVPGVAIHGRSFPQKDVPADFARSYPAPDSERFNIGVLHTSLNGAKGAKDHPEYAPCSIDHLAALNYDYWALGHIHKREEVRGENPVIVYPGNIQGRHVRETGPKGCYVVTVDDEKQITGLTFHPLDVVRWDTYEHDPKGENDLEKLVGQSCEGIRPRLEMAGDRLLVIRLYIRGSTPLHVRFQTRRVDAVAQFRAGALNEFGDSVWIESVRFETSMPSSGDNLPQLPDDALTEIQGVLSELKNDPVRLAEVIKDLETLNDKLPSQLRDGADPLLITDPVWAAKVLDRIYPLLTDADFLLGDGK